MQPVVIRWSGAEVAALRQAFRLSVRQFAQKVGCSDRIISRWESLGATTYLRHVYAAVMDTLLTTAPPEVRTRFGNQFATIAALDVAVSVPPDLRAVLRLEPDERLMALVDAGPHHKDWVPAFAVDVRPVSIGDLRQFSYHTDHLVHLGDDIGHDPDTPAPVTRTTTRLYTTWTGRHLPTTVQLARARQLPGIVTSREEWRLDPRDATILGPKAGTATFRTIAPLPNVLRQLSI